MAEDFDLEAFAIMLSPGCRYIAVPIELILDPLLRPLDKVAWQMLAVHKKYGAHSSSESASQFLLRSLAVTGDDRKVSQATVTSTLQVLRLRGWIIRMNTRINNMDSYCFHDERLEANEAVEMDAQFKKLVYEKQHSKSPIIKNLAKIRLRELEVGTEPKKTRLQHIYENLAAQVEKSRESPYGPFVEEVMAGFSRRMAEMQASSCSDVDSTANLSQQQLQQLLGGKERQAFEIVKSLEPVIQQQVIEELLARCSKAEIKNPLGYLRGLVKRVENNNFRPWASL